MNPIVAESGFQRAIRVHRIGCLYLNYTIVASYLISARILSESEHKAIKDLALSNETRMDELLGIINSRMNQACFEAFIAGVLTCNNRILASNLEVESGVGYGTAAGRSTSRRSRYRTNGNLSEGLPLPPPYLQIPVVVGHPVRYQPPVPPPPMMPPGIPIFNGPTNPNLNGPVNAQPPRGPNNRVCPLESVLLHGGIGNPNGNGSPPTRGN